MRKIKQRFKLVHVEQGSCAENIGLYHPHKFYLSRPVGEQPDVLRLVFSRGVEPPKRLTIKYKPAR